jgi:uncharacterized membrane protein
MNLFSAKILLAILAALLTIAAVLTRWDKQRASTADENAAFHKRVVEKMDRNLPDHLHLP